MEIILCLIAGIMMSALIMLSFGVGYYEGLKKGKAQDDAITINKANQRVAQAYDKFVNYQG